MPIVWFAAIAVVGGIIQRTNVFRRATPLVFFLGVATFLLATLFTLLQPPIWFSMLAGGIGWICGFIIALFVPARRRVD